MSNKLNEVLKKFGVIINKYPTSDLSRRIKIIINLGITVLLDIGASRGEYGKIIRNIGYSGKIISFEPLNEPFIELQKQTQKEKKWDAYNYALGNFDGETEINISDNFVSSSILRIKEIHTRVDNKSRQTSKETVNVKKLDTVFSSLVKKGETVFMKLDTQGYEKYILEGAKNILSEIAVIQIELSIESLYDDSHNYLEMIEFLREAEFDLWSVEPGFQDHSTGRLFQFDGIFVDRRFYNY